MWVVRAANPNIIYARGSAHGDKGPEREVGGYDGTAFWTRGGGLLSGLSASSVELPRISMLANARVLAGSGWLGLKDREAFVTRGVKLIPMFTGLMALAALLALLALTWWREGR